MPPGNRADVSRRLPSRQRFAKGIFLASARGQHPCLPGSGDHTIAHRDPPRRRLDRQYRPVNGFRGHYLPDESSARDPRASPLLAEEFSGLPRAHIATAGFDVLRDEGEEYAHRLTEAGVPVTLRRHSGLVHGLANALGVGKMGRSVLLEAAGALRAGLAGTGAVVRNFHH